MDSASIPERVIVRIAETGDIEALFSIRTSVIQNHLSREELAAMGITPDSLRELIVSEPCAWIAETDGTPAGFSIPDLAEGSVFAMLVRPEFEGRGLGRLLMQCAEESLFRRHGVIWLVTSAADEVRANGFYRKLGWRPAGPLEGGDWRYEKQAPETGE